MKAAQALRQDDIIEFIDTLFDGDLHAKRVLSLANAAWGVLTSASLAVHAIGQGLAHAQGTLSKHGVKQVDRLLSNRGIKLARFFACWVPYVIGARTKVVVALDWTSFANDGHETLVLSMLTRHGRATPLLWQTVEAATLKGRQTDYEDALLCRLYEVLPAGVAVTIVADRGFADCKLLKLLSEELGFGYVVRLRSQYYITNAKGERRKAAKWVGTHGRARTLRDATLTDSQALPVATVVCVQAKDMKEPWCLAASDREAKAKTLIGYYAKRWGIETSFRDIKDLRFGMGMSSLRIGRPERRDRLLLISALAIALLSLLGAAGEALGYDRWLKANTVKRRTHSLFRQGLMLYEHIPNWPEERLRPLFEKFTELLHEQRVFRDAFGII
ncbi:MAG: IS4 family transposase [Gammaproteobacteria bacterium]|nr:IS4 family transposase [Gammaproteobacteria bacterium]MDZ7753319.1 IS4 family transposase [Gammaproteobacteria bacterium]